MISLFLALSTTGMGCASSDPVSIGDNARKTGESLSDYGADWDGYVEAWQAGSGSDHVHVSLDENGQGYLEVGDAAAPEPPTDPDSEYLTGEDAASARLVEGFRYTVVDASVEARRIRLSVNNLEHYATWCELQTPILNTEVPDGVEYSCAPVQAGGGGIRDGKCYVGDPDDPQTRAEISCVRAEHCLIHPVCACTADGCTASGEATRILDAALSIDADELDGTIVVNGDHSVHLLRE